MIKEQIKDHFLSQEIFQLKEHKCGILSTQPQPPAEELTKYYQSQDYISHTDSKRSIFDWIYQQAKNINLKAKRNLVTQYQTSGTLLDYGCGVGDFLLFMKDIFKGTGIEPNPSAALIAKKKTQLQINTSTDLSVFEENSFDVITLWHVLEHVPNLEEITQQIKRILKKEGTLIIAVPNYNSYDAEYYGAYWAAYDVPRHLWHFSQDSMKNLWSKLDFQCVQTAPMLLDAYYVSILSEKYKNKSIFNFPMGVIRGFISNQKAKKTGEYSSMIYVFKRK